MVLINFKKNQKNKFLIQVPSTLDVHTVILKLLEINNARILLERLSKAVNDLATYGPLRPPELQGLSYEDIAKYPQEIAKLDEARLQYATKPKPEAPYRYVYDKSNTRHGVVLPQEQSNFLKQTARGARKLAMMSQIDDKTNNNTKSSKENNNQVVAANQTESMILTQNIVLEAVDMIRGAIMVTYPGYYGLPEWEPVVLMLENRLDYQVLASEDYEYYSPDANLWWAGKELQKNKLISQYIPKNSEKTRIIVKLQNPGAQQPPREPPVDAETYRKMVQYYYKKTQQGKQLQKQELRNQYLTGEWANKNLKAELTVGKSVTYKPF